MQKLIKQQWQTAFEKQCMIEGEGSFAAIATPSLLLYAPSVVWFMACTSWLAPNGHLRGWGMTKAHSSWSISAWCIFGFLCSLHIHQWKVAGNLHVPHPLWPIADYQEAIAALCGLLWRIIWAGEKGSGAPPTTTREGRRTWTATPSCSISLFLCRSHAFLRRWGISATIGSTTSVHLIQQNQT